MSAMSNSPSSNTGAQQPTHDVSALLNAGAALHAQHQLEQALMQFERALAADPSSVNAINACVAVLLDLDRPRAAFDLMRSNLLALATDVDSLCNWAIVCESVGERSRADAAYEQVLSLQPNHLRALNNSALNAMVRHEWPLAIQRLERCCQLAPDDPALLVNLVDGLTAAHESEEALKAVAQGHSRWPNNPDLELRYAIQLAFNGRLHESDAAIARLSHAAQTRLQHYLSSMSEAAARLGRAAVQSLPAAQELYFIHQFSALGHCDWRDYPRLVSMIRQAIQSSYTEERGRDWRDVQFYALMLPLEEEEQCQCVRHTYRNIVDKFPLRSAPTKTHTPSLDGKIHVGLTLQSLHDARHRNAIENWLTHADRDRFSYHLYANTPLPQVDLTDRLISLSESVVEINHLSVGDTIKRMRLDRLDVYLDTAFYTPWCRAEIPYGNVAPINIRMQSWQRWNSGVYQYVLGDAITHPDEIDRNYLGPTVRLPETCWLALNDDQPIAGVTRKEVGLADDAIVFAAFSAPIGIDPQSFSAWMAILKSLPDAIVWFPLFDLGTRANLLREARLHGVAASRIAFCPSPPTLPQGDSINARQSSEYHRAWHLAQLKCADFFLDPLRFGSNYTLCDALRLGVPSATVMGNNLASRLGASILRAAHLDTAVLASTEEYVSWACEWARGGKLADSVSSQLSKIQNDPQCVPLYNASARIKSWEQAMEKMAEKSRNNLAPEAFDI